jgi:hypothetical protein
MKRLTTKLLGASVIAGALLTSALLLPGEARAEHSRSRTGVGARANPSMLHSTRHGHSGHGHSGHGHGGHGHHARRPSVSFYYGAPAYGPVWGPSYGYGGNGGYGHSYCPLGGHGMYFGGSGLRIGIGF